LGAIALEASHCLIFIDLLLLLGSRGSLKQLAVDFLFFAFLANLASLAFCSNRSITVLFFHIFVHLGAHILHFDLGRKLLFDSLHTGSTAKVVEVNQVSHIGALLIGGCSPGIY
jgi:5'(3')-deoxyribonucleotidase